ncbi:MAG: two-component regulator propeller domain-containing protein, partial [Bryobacteraceae bacterium]
RRISALLPLADGHVLVGTPSNGLYISDGKSLRLFHSQFSRAEITALAGDENQFWIGTRNDRAWLWRGGEALHVSADLPDKQVLSLAANGDDAWVGTPLGVAEFKSGKLSRHLANGAFAQALAEHNGKLWIGTLDQGAFAIPLATEKPRPQLSSEASRTDSIVSFARIGTALAAIEPRAVVVLPDRQPLIKAPANQLTSSHITSVHEDSRGRLWIGYFDRGIDSVLQSGSGALTHLEDDTLFCINRIKDNPNDGSILVATANGLAVFDIAGKLRQVLNRENGLIAGNVTDVLFQRDGSAELTLAIATPAGLSFIEHGSISSIYAFHGLVNNHVFTLADLNGTLYAGTLGGVSTLRRGLVQASFTTANSPLRQNWVTASAVFGGHLYLGTYGSGVLGFDENGAVQSFSAFAGRRFEINLNALLATDRALYAGTAGQGLAILRANETRWQFVSDGLPSENVTALDERNGRLYIGTDNGLVRISENNLLP